MMKKKLTRITNDPLEKFRQNLSRCTNRNGLTFEPLYGLSSEYNLSGNYCHCTATWKH